jgi:transposase, orfB family
VIKSIKLRIYPNKTQLKIIDDTLGACNFIKNKYLEYNIKNYKKDEKCVTDFDFSKYVNKLKKEDSEYSWIKGISSKAIQEAIISKYRSFKSFFKNKNGFPKFKSRKRMSKESYYFINEQNNYYTNNKNIIKIPKLKKIRITNGDDLPDENSIMSGRIIRHYNKYYVMFIYNEDNDNRDIIKNDIKLGIDLGVKDYAIIYDGYECHHYKHFKDLNSYKKLNERLIKLQKVITKKVEYNYGKKLNEYLDKYNEEPSEIIKNELKGEAYKSYNIRKIFNKINKIRVKLINIRDNFIKQLINKLTARIKPSKINIEDLDISNMIGDNKTTHKLHGLIAESSLYKFKTHLINKCKEYVIKLRLVDQYYPSTQICSECGHKNTNIRLVDRTYVCDKCRMVMDRDENSAINIYNCKSKNYIEIA